MEKGNIAEAEAHFAQLLRHAPNALEPEPYEQLARLFSTRKIMQHPIGAGKLLLEPVMRCDGERAVYPVLESGAVGGVPQFLSQSGGGCERVAGWPRREYGIVVSHVAVRRKGAE